MIKNLKTNPLIALVLSIVLVTGSLFIANSLDKEEPQVENSKPVRIARNILVLGSDSAIPRSLRDYRARSDVMLLLSINQEEDTAVAISIPRDTKVMLKKKMDRINAANAIGGYRMARNAVERLLGTEIDNVLVFNMAGFINLADEIGGIEINVKKKMSYHDETADLHIEFEPGVQTMDGETLVNYLRYRSDELGDIGRIQRQQHFFKKALKKIMEPEILFKMPQIIQLANKSFRTNMSFQEMFSLGTFLKSVPRRNIKFYILPGDFGTGKDNSYWISNKEEIKELIKSKIK